MSELLSIAAAAAERPEDVAIVAGERELTFAECARLASEAPEERARIATPTVETIVAIYAALEARRSIGLVHHRLAAAEQARQRGVVEEATQADRFGEPHDDRDLARAPAAILFTSGSTGVARGVEISRGALEAAARAHAAHMPWRDDDAWLLAVSMAHAAGLAIVVRCLAARQPVVLGELADIARATIASLVPTQLIALLDDDAWRPSATLRAILLGGAASPRALLERAAARGVPFLTTYGMTESIGQVATAPIERAGEPDAPLVPLPGVAIEAGTAAAAARIVVRAPMLATRYLDGRPIAPAFETADLGARIGGTLVVMGRVDDVIITGGENVSPAAIEAVLAATPGVRAAVVYAVDDPRWGQVVCAAIVPAPDFDRPAARAHWLAHLTGYQLPRELAIVEALPLNANGKVDRRAAAELPRERMTYK